MKVIRSFYKQSYIPIEYITLVFEYNGRYYVKNIHNDEIQITKETYDSLVSSMEVIGENN